MLQNNILLSVGIMTYNRNQLLKETIKSITKYANPKLEIIIGNDYIDKKITLKSLNIKDERIKIINNVENLGEMKNMMNILHKSKGSFFTWIADDDYYIPEFFKIINNILENNKKKVYFVQHFTDILSIKNYNKKKLNFLPQKKFLDDYLSNKINIHGCYAVFEKKFLQSIKGMEILGCGFSPYSDVLLTIKSCQEKNIAIIDKPFIYYRLHDQSISYSSDNYISYTSAQKDLLKKIQDYNFLDDKQKYRLIITLSRDIIEIYFRSKLKLLHLISHLVSISSYLSKLNILKLTYISSRFFLYKFLKNILMFIFK